MLCMGKVVWEHRDQYVHVYDGWCDRRQETYCTGRNQKLGHKHQFMQEKNFNQINTMAKDTNHRLAGWFNP